MRVRRPLFVLAVIVGLYALAWVGYVVKSAAGIDLIAYDAPVVGGHHGAWFPGSDPVVRWLQRR